MPFYLVTKDPQQVLSSQVRRAFVRYDPPYRPARRWIQAELSVFDQPRRGLTWIAAGPGWAAPELPPGVTFVDGLVPAARLIEAAHTDPVRRH